MATLINTIDDSFSQRTCEQWQNDPANLLEILHAVQHKQGYLSDKALRTIAYALNISRAEIHGVVSFYHDFKREKQADQVIKICRAEACQSVGAEGLIEDAQSAFGVTLDGGGTDVALESAFCLGNCALGPAVLIENALYGRVDISKLKKHLMKHRKGSKI